MVAHNARVSSRGTQAILGTLMATSDPDRSRRLDGWGFTGETLEPSPLLEEWLTRQVGRGTPVRRGPHEATRLPPPTSLPPLPVPVHQDARERLSHARGQGLPDVLRLRTGTLTAAPDGVCRPDSAAGVEALLAACTRSGVRVIPWGGGTSVTGGVNPVAGDSPIVTLDLANLSGLSELDLMSGLATFGAGTTGPQVEAALADHGLTLGHYPQSWELSTVGGWVVTRSSGQESLGYGRIEDMVAGLELVAPAGRLALPPLPASAAGPDLRQLVLGSEGRLGVVTRTTLRVRRRPARLVVKGAVFPSWGEGLAAARTMVQAGVPLSLLRLSDGPETEVALAVGLAGHTLRPLVLGYLRARGVGVGSCLLLYGAAGDPDPVDEVLGEAWAHLAEHNAVGLGRPPGRSWLRDRFRHPYLRDALLDRGWATDTLETAAPWSRLDAVAIAVRKALTTVFASRGLRAAVLCHLSHPYRDGASLYFTFFFPCADDVAATIAHWAAAKRAATAVLVDAGATLSHHHGVGQWHAPWWPHEVGVSGRDLVRAAAGQLDPAGILNPHVLLDPSDRLEA